jgi:hypothetical protein
MTLNKIDREKTGRGGESLNLATVLHTEFPAIPI